MMMMMMMGELTTLPRPCSLLGRGHPRSPARSTPVVRGADRVKDWTAALAVFNVPATGAVSGAGLEL